MNSERFDQRRRDFLNVATRLQEAASKEGDDILRDATIQRFEFTFEAAWKALQMYLQHQGLEANDPRQVLKQAFAQGIIPSPEEADIWLDMLEDRSLTTHTCRESLAEAIAANIRARYASRLLELAERLSRQSLD